MSCLLPVLNLKLLIVVKKLTDYCSGGDNRQYTLPYMEFVSLQTKLYNIYHKKSQRPYPDSVQYSSQPHNKYGAYLRQLPMWYDFV